MAPSPHTLRAGDVVGGYLLRAPLGRGGSGSAWLVESAGEEHCLKLLDRAAAAHLHEVRLVAALSHPNVVRVLDQAPETTSHPAWLVMPVARGGTLGERLRDGPLAPERIRAWTVQLLRALAHAHARHVLHLDVKPANVLLAEDREDAPIWLADFGIGTRRGTLDTAKGRGTPGFVAPEQLRGSAAPLGPHTDLFGLGCTVVALITGRVPRPTGSDPPGGPTPIDLDGIDPTWQAWLRTLLAVDPSDRVRTAPRALATLPLAPPQLPGAATFTSEATTALTLDGGWETVPGAPLSEPAAPAAPSTTMPDASASNPLRLFSVRALPMVGRTTSRDRVWHRLRELPAHPGWVALRGTDAQDTSDVARWVMEQARESGVARALGDQPGVDGRELAHLVEVQASSTALGDDAFLDRLAGVLGARAVRRSALWSLARVVRPEIDVPVVIRSSNEGTAALVPWLESLCEDGPVVLWASPDRAQDAARLERRLARTRPDLPVLTLFTGPVDGLTLDPDRGDVVDVPPLSPAEHALLLRSLLPLEGGLMEEVYRLTRGAPALLVDVLRWWVDEGVLVGGAEGLHLAPGQKASVPPDLTALPRQRIQAALRGWAADVAGPILAVGVAWEDQWTRERWKAALRPSLAVHVDAISDALLGAHLVEPHGGGLGWSSPRIRSAAHAVCAPFLPAASAGCSEVATTENLNSAIRGRLLAGAGAHGPAIDLLCEAVDDPRTYSTLVDQLALLARAERCADALSLDDAHPRRARILQRRAQLMLKRGHHTEAKALALRVVDAGVGGATGEGALRVIADACARTGALAEARDWIARAMAEPPTDPETRVWTASTAVNVFVRSGRMDEARVYLDAAEAVEARTARIRFALALARDTVARACRNMEVREQLLADALQAATELGHRPSEGAMLCNQGDLAREVGDLARAETALREARDLLDACGMDINVGLAEINLAQVALQREDGPAARVELDRATRRLELLGARHYLAFARLLGAEADQLTGVPGEVWAASLRSALDQVNALGMNDADVLDSLRRQRARSTVALPWLDEALEQA